MVTARARWRSFRLPADAPYRLLVGVGGIGSAIFLALDGNHTLGRNESRPARQLDVRDYCKLHIISHYVAVLLGADAEGDGFRVLPIGRVGNDAVGSRMTEEMANAGMDVRFVQADPERPTTFGVCFQYPDGSGGNITANNGASSALTAVEVSRAGPYLAANRGRSMALAAPEVPLPVRLHLLDLATAHHALRVAAFTSVEIAQGGAGETLALVDLVALNEDEASALTGRPFSPRDPQPFLADCAQRLTAFQPRIRIVLTVGRCGAYAYEGGRWDYCPALEVPAVNTAGAGDALLAGVMCGLVAGIPLITPGPPRAAIGERPLSSALDLGVLLAALTVTSPHTIHPGADAASLTELARDHGLRFSGRLDRLVASGQGESRRRSPRRDGAEYRVGV